MKPARLVLALNCGSSSIKFALVDPETGQRAASALGERVGTADAEVTAQRNDLVSTTTPSDTSQRGVIEHLVSALSADERGRILGVGHRVVHGGSRFTEPTLVDDDVVAGIRDVAELAPLHVIGNLSGIEAIRDLLPEVANVAVFDTAFHRTLPEVAYRYAVPGAWFTDHGVRRYGFHGISHRFVSERAADLIGKPVADLRLVTLHLGNGCSAAAVTGGVSVDTTMGFTPMEGLVMGSRSGDIDPGVIGYMAQRLDSDAHAVIDELNHRSGLLGLSGLSNDMRALIEAAADGGDAALAVDVFCYRAAKVVGALAVVLGRLDAVVFTGGIGEHSTQVRRRVLERLQVFGLTIDEVANANHGQHSRGRISLDGPTVALVVPTDEELMIARDTAALVRSH